MMGELVRDLESGWLEHNLGGGEFGSICASINEPHWECQFGAGSSGNDGWDSRSNITLGGEVAEGRTCLSEPNDSKYRCWKGANDVLPYVPCTNENLLTQLAYSTDEDAARELECEVSPRGAEQNTRCMYEVADFGGSRGGEAPGCQNEEVKSGRGACILCCRSRISTQSTNHMLPSCSGRELHGGRMPDIKYCPSSRREVRASSNEGSLQDQHTEPCAQELGRMLTERTFKVY